MTIQQQLDLYVKQKKETKKSLWALQKSIYDILPKCVQDAMTHECWVTVNEYITCSNSPIGCCIYDSMVDKRQDFCIFCAQRVDYYEDFE